MSVRHFGTSAEVSGHFGHAEVSWVRTLVGPKCPGSEVSVHRLFRRFSSFNRQPAHNQGEAGLCYMIRASYHVAQISFRYRERFGTQYSGSQCSSSEVGVFFIAVVQVPSVRIRV